MRLRLKSLAHRESGSTQNRDSLCAFRSKPAHANASAYKPEYEARLFVLLPPLTSWICSITLHVYGHVPPEPVRAKLLAQCALVVLVTSLYWQNQALNLQRYALYL